MSNKKEVKPVEKNLGKVSQITIVDEMKTSYIDYAMSVIVSRALPDVRDGLKPVHRRILYAMWKIGLKHNSKFRKSAHVVGEVMAKYHPHGDASIYDSMVRMAQDFSMRNPLVNGQGNFGSMDGDSAAAMRYTEAKLREIAEEMLVDIEKDTVDFASNYDASTKEPKVLPSKLPHLLLNGNMGIAVGMATNIAPHNLSELCDGIYHLIDNPQATIEELMEFIKGPDFPTGATIYSKKDILTAFATGRGGIVMRAKTNIEEFSSNKFRIVVTEVPYQVNKARLIEKIADLVHDKKLEGIRDLRDETNKEGVRIVVELKKDAYPKKVLNQLFKMTELQTTFHVNQIALIDGIQPQVLSIKTILEEHIKHRQIVIRRRTEYDLKKAEERAHILDGLKIAIDKIDVVIKIIRASKDKDEAKVNLIKEFSFTDRQTIAILEMRLQQLANLEAQKVAAELAEKMKLINFLKAILGSEEKVLQIIKDDLLEMKERFGEPRRTNIIAHGIKEFNMEDLVPNESTIIMATRGGYIKRLPIDTFKSQNRGGKGVVGIKTKEEDMIEHLISTNTHDTILFFTTRGRVFQLHAYDIPETSRTAKGQALVNFLQLAPNESVSSVLSMADMSKYEFLVMVTNKGTIKRSKLSDFKNLRKSGLIALNIKDDDMLEWVRPSTGKDDIMLVTELGQAIRFKELSVRAMGRTAGGVRGIKLKSNDGIVGMDIISTGLVKQGVVELLVMAENGLGKRTPIKEYKVQGRGGSGIKTMNITNKTGKIVAAKVINKTELQDALLISKNGQVVRTAIKNISTLGRATQGARIMRFKEKDDRLVTMAIIEQTLETDEEEVN